MTARISGRDLTTTAPTVRVSSFCSAGDCVGVRMEEHGVRVVSTKNSGASLWFDRDEWAAFVEGVKNGEFDTA